MPVEDWKSRPAADGITPRAMNASRASLLGVGLAQQPALDRARDPGVAVALLEVEHRGGTARLLLGRGGLGRPLALAIHRSLWRRRVVHGGTNLPWRRARHQGAIG